jgi:heme A synthase
MDLLPRAPLIGALTHKLGALLLLLLSLAWALCLLMLQRRRIAGELRHED